MEEAIFYTLALSLQKNYGTMLIKKIMDHYGSAKAFFEWAAQRGHRPSVERLPRQRPIITKEIAAAVNNEMLLMKQHNINCCIYTDEHYPQRLRHCVDAPAFFFYKGLHEYEMYSRQTETIYGDNAEAKKLLADYAGEIDVYKKLRSQNRNRLSILILCLLVVPVIIHLFAPKGKDEYLSDREQFPVPYQMSSYSKTLLPYPGYDGVYPWYTDYLKVDGNVELMFDVDPQNYQIGLPEREAKTIYRLRVEPMRVLSTGKRIKETDTCNFGVFLFDKDKKRVGRQLGHIRHRNNHESDNIRTVLWKGCGDYYAKFVGDSSSVDAEMMRQIADSAYYFMIF